jgi:hypothetical protein
MVVFIWLVRSLRESYVLLGRPICVSSLKDLLVWQAQVEKTCANEGLHNKPIILYRFVILRKVVTTAFHKWGTPHIAIYRLQI